jgi:hypothetical protein
MPFVGVRELKKGEPRMLDNKKLNVPRGVDEKGIVEDTYALYTKAVIAIPEMLESLIASVDSLADSIDIMALYAERKGKSEGILSDDDLNDNANQDN